VSKIRSRFFPLAFLAAKTTIKALDLTGHAGGTLPGAIAEAIDPAFLGDIAKPDQVVFISEPTEKQPQITCSMICLQIMDIIRSPIVWEAISQAVLQVHLREMLRLEAR